MLFPNDVMGPEYDDQDRDDEPVEGDVYDPLDIIDLVTGYDNDYPTPRIVEAADPLPLPETLPAIEAAQLLLPLPDDAA